MQKITIHAKLVDKENDIGGYIIYVFKNLESTDWTNTYIMCTRVPNWQTGNISIGDVGYMTYQEVIAGEDTWYDFKTNKNQLYRFSQLYFIDFVKEKRDKLKDYIL